MGGLADPSRSCFGKRLAQGRFVETLHCVALNDRHWYRAESTGEELRIRLEVVVHLLFRIRVAGS